MKTRNLLIAAAAVAAASVLWNLAEIADEPPEVYESWKSAAEIVPSADVLRAVDLLAEALVRLRIRRGLALAALHEH